MDRDTTHATLLLLGYISVLSFDAGLIPVKGKYTFYRHPTRQSIWVDANGIIHQGNANLGPGETALATLIETNNVN